MIDHFIYSNLIIGVRLQFGLVGNSKVPQQHVDADAIMSNEIYKNYFYINVNYICIMFLPRLNVAISDGRTGQSNLLDISISSIILFPSILEVIGEIMEVEWKVCRCSAPWGGE